MKDRIFLLRSGFLLLVLSIVACTINVGGPAYPENSIPVSTDAAGEIESVVQTSVAASISSGQITFIISENQITSFLYYKLQSQTDPLFENPQVYLRDGQIQIFGTAHQGYFVATISIILSAGVDDQGQLMLALTSADFGPLPVPAGIKDAITAIIQEAYTGAIGPVATGFRLEGITIDGGTMTITGKIK